MWNVKRDGGKVKAGRFTGGNHRDTEAQRKIRVIQLAVSLCLCVLIPSLIQGASLVAGWVVGWVVGASARIFSAAGPRSIETWPSS